MPRSGESSARHRLADPHTLYRVQSFIHAMRCLRIFAAAPKGHNRSVQGKRSGGSREASPWGKVARRERQALKGRHCPVSPFQGLINRGGSLTQGVAPLALG